MARERTNLIDTRGRKTILDTRKRRRDSVLTPSHERNRSQTPPRAPKMHRPNVDLGAMIKPSGLPHDKYKAIQTALFEQDKIIMDRGDEIKDRCSQIHGLKKDLDDANKKIDYNQDRLEKKTHQIDDLRKQLAHAKREKEEATTDLLKRKKYFEDVTNDQEDLIKVGRKMLGEKNQEVERLKEENKQLRTTVSNGDSSISSLNDQIMRISMGSGDEMAAIAIEAQAQRTLAMVKGLKKDVAQRDVVIEDYKAKIIALNAANEGFKKENAELESKYANGEKALKAVAKRAAESKEILEEQNKLIDRLMKENARLLENSGKMK